MSRPESRTPIRALHRLVELVAYLAGVAAAVLVVRQIATVMEFVVVGPLSLPIRGSAEGVAVAILFERMGIPWSAGMDATRGAVLTLLAAAAVLTVRVRHSWGARHASIVAQIALSLAVLAYSFRLAGVLAVVWVTVWQVSRWPGYRLAWAGWVLFVGLCLLPVDLSFRNLPGPARLAETRQCATIPALQEYARGEGEYVCVGMGAQLYRAPRWVWVW